MSSNPLQFTWAIKMWMLLVCVMTWNNLREGIFEHLSGLEKAFLSISPYPEPCWILTQSCTYGMLYNIHRDNYSQEVFVVPLRKEHWARSPQQLALLAAEFMGILPRPGPATEQQARRPQSEHSDKERWGPLLFWALCLSRASGLVPYCMFPGHEASSLSFCNLQKPWLSCRASVGGFPIIHMLEARRVQKSEARLPGWL